VEKFSCYVSGSGNEKVGGLCYDLFGEEIFEVQPLRTYARQADRQALDFVMGDQFLPSLRRLWDFGRQSQAEFPLQVCYDQILPINLRLELFSPSSEDDVVLIHPDVPLPSGPIEKGTVVRLEDFVVSKVDLARQTVTLNLPARKDSVPQSYFVRVQSIEALDTYHVGQRFPAVTGIVVDTREARLQREAQAALGPDQNLVQPLLTTRDGVTLPNPLLMLSDILRETRHVWISHIHGDLNLGNILVELKTGKVGLIDFAEARKGYILHDFLRLETEVMVHLLPEIIHHYNLPLVPTLYHFCQHLHRATLDDRPLKPVFAHADLARPFAVLVAVRRASRHYWFDRDDLTEYYQGLVVYLLGALKFDNLNTAPTAPLPKQVAFRTAAAVCNILNPVPVKSGPVDWQAVQQYLPPEVYEMRDYPACLAHLHSLLRAVVSYVPRHLALELLQNPVIAKSTGQFLEGTLLFADISGFTNLSEALQEKDDKAGAEALVNLINTYLDMMLSILFIHSGLLVKFGGDAMLCLFTGEDQGALNAVWTAWEMQQAMDAHFAEIEMLQEVYPLAMKVGSNSGRLFAVTVGTVDHMEYILTGDVVERTAHVESVAHSGEILISRETYKRIGANLEIEAVEENPDFFRVKAFAAVPSQLTQDLWSHIGAHLSALTYDWAGIVQCLKALTPFLPTGILRRLVLDPGEGQIEGQYCRATILFANFSGMDDVIRAYGVEHPDEITDVIQEYFVAMQEEIQYYGGVIDKVDLYNQGDKLMVLFGAPEAHEFDIQRAALAALAMQEAMQRLSPLAATLLTQRIGIHTGFVFAGNVGSSTCNQREYTVMGETVNLAARLMAAAPPGTIWVSPQVWKSLEATFNAQALPPVSFKGIR
jgi:class 3 adenylate cyclase